ncbi:MAG: peptidylprolyl isomerase [Phycisphaerae bacterium]
MTERRQAVRYPWEGWDKHRWRLAAVALLLLCGCATTPEAPPVTVADAWQSSSPKPVAEDQAARFVPSPDAGDVVAVVQGVPITRSRVVDLLIESHGVGLLEQLIVLESARQRAKAEGIRISKADVDAEYQRSLSLLVGESGDNEPDSLRTKAGESMLEDMLLRRNSSRIEYMLVMERNAILRKLVENRIVVDQASLEAEFSRLHGERAQIRHIQIASRADFERMLAERAGGAEFGDLAVRYSVNQASAERLGLLPPFTKDDPNIPEVIRREAFLLPAGQDSNPIYVDGWYHIIRVERRIDADKVSLEEVRDEVEQSLRQRLTNAAIVRLHAELFNESKVEIVDPALAKLFYDRHPAQGTVER